jgi:hypothetical protein
MVEREITDGRHYLGTVREHPDGRFVAVIDEHVVGAFNTIAEATDKIIDLARRRGST